VRVPVGLRSVGRARHPGAVETNRQADEHTNTRCVGRRWPHGTRAELCKRRCRLAQDCPTTMGSRHPCHRVWSATRSSADGRHVALCLPRGSRCRGQADRPRTLGARVGSGLGRHLQSLAARVRSTIGQTLTVLTRTAAGIGLAIAWSVLGCTTSSPASREFLTRCEVLVEDGLGRDTCTAGLHCNSVAGCTDLCASDADCASLDPDAICAFDHHGAGYRTVDGGAIRDRMGICAVRCDTAADCERIGSYLICGELGYCAVKN